MYDETAIDFAKAVASMARLYEATTYPGVFENFSDALNALRRVATVKFEDLAHKHIDEELAPMRDLKVQAQGGL